MRIRTGGDGIGCRRGIYARSRTVPEMSSRVLDEHPVETSEEYSKVIVSVFCAVGF